MQLSEFRCTAAWCRAIWDTSAMEHNRKFSATECIYCSKKLFQNACFMYVFSIQHPSAKINSTVKQVHWHHVMMRCHKQGQDEAQHFVKNCEKLKTCPSTPQAIAESRCIYNCNLFSVPSQVKARYQQHLEMLLTSLGPCWTDGK